MHVCAVSAFGRALSSDGEGRTWHTGCLEKLLEGRGALSVSHAAALALTSCRHNTGQHSTARKAGSALSRGVVHGDARFATALPGSPHLKVAMRDGRIDLRRAKGEKHLASSAPRQFNARCNPDLGRRVHGRAARAIQGYQGRTYDH